MLKNYENFKEKSLQVYNFNIKKMYIDKLDDVLNKYKNTFNRAIKLKPVNAHQTHILFLIKKKTRNILVNEEYQI